MPETPARAYIVEVYLRAVLAALDLLPTPSLRVVGTTSISAGQSIPSRAEPRWRARPTLLGTVPGHGNGEMSPTGYARPCAVVA